MNDQNRIESTEQKKGLVADQYRLFTRPIAKLALLSKLNRHQLLYFIDEQVVREAHKQDPAASKVQLAVRTGVDRRFISRYLTEENPKIKQNKLTLILDRFKHVLKNTHPPGTTKIPKVGPFQTFQSLCEEYIHGTLTYQSVLQELVQNKNVIDHGDSVELISADNVNINELMSYFDMSVNLFNRFASTIKENTEISELKDQHYQMSAVSTQIPPENIDNAKADIKKQLRKNFDDLIAVLEKHEINVKPGSYRAIGVSLLEFLDEE